MKTGDENMGIIAAFLIHVNTRQLPKQTPTYIEKKHYHVGKMLPTWVLYGSQILDFNPMMFRLEHLSCRKYR